MLALPALFMFNDGSQCNKSHRGHDASATAMAKHLIVFPSLGAFGLFRLCRLGLLNDIDRAMIVAVALVVVMQSTINEIVNVVAVRDGFVSARRSVDVAGGMAFVRRSALLGVGSRHSDLVLIDVIAVHVMQMSIVDIVNMPVMLDGGVAAILAVLVLVILVFVAFFHGHALLKE
jgi:hypothetical protein